jgi:hypothetical protein
MTDLDRHFHLMTLATMGLIACMGLLNLVLLIWILSTVQPQDKPVPSLRVPACCATYTGVM